MAPPESDIPDLDEWRSKMERKMRSGIRYYNREGEAITQAEWILLHDPVYKRVALSAVGPYVISTVWLGLDHGFSFYNDTPIIFESMVFARSGWEGKGDDHYMGEVDMERYSTEEQAREGHKRMVNLIAATMQTVDGSEPEIEWEYESD